MNSPQRLQAAVEMIQTLHNEFEMRTVFSVHPRTRKRIEENSLPLPSNAMSMPPLRFSDYIALQREAYCVISDSGTITEESNIVGFPAITPRFAHERPEGMDEGVLVMSDLSASGVTEAIKAVTSQTRNGQPYQRNRVHDYQYSEVSEKVVRIILSYTDYIRRTVWRQ